MHNGHDVERGICMLVRHSMSYLFARGGPSLLLLAATVVLTNTLSPSEYGSYSVVIAWVTLGNLLLFEWLRMSLLRFYPAHREADGGLLSTVGATYRYLVGASALAMGALFVTDTLRLSTTVLLGAVLLWLQGFHDLSAELGRSRLRPLTYGLLNAARSVGLLVFGGGLAALGWGAQGVLLGLAATMLATGVWSLCRLWPTGPQPPADSGLRRQLIELGIPLCAILGLSYVMDLSDRIVIDALLGKAAAGLYAVGYDLPRQTLGAIMMVVTLAGYPLTVRAFETGGVEAARRQLRSTGDVLLMVALPAAAGLSILAAPIAGSLLGAEYVSTAAGLMPVIALGVLLNGVRAYYLDHGFSLAKRFRLQIAAVGAGAVINVPLTILLVKRFGVMGAAFATAISYGVALLASALLVRRVFPVPWPAELPKIAGATIVMVVVLKLLGTPQDSLALVGVIVAAVVTYATCCVAFDVKGLRRRVLFRSDTPSD